MSALQASSEQKRARDAAAQAVMQGFVADNSARGVSPTARLFCDACEGPRSMPGFLAYARCHLCNPCATEYEVAQAQGCVASPGCFVHDKRCGEAEAYALPSPRRATSPRQK